MNAGNAEAWTHQPKSVLQVGCKYECLSSNLSVVDNRDCKPEFQKPKSFIQQILDPYDAEGSEQEISWPSSYRTDILGRETDINSSQKEWPVLPRGLHEQVTGIWCDLRDQHTFAWGKNIFAGIWLCLHSEAMFLIMWVVDFPGDIIRTKDHR